ncbi:MAG TPA: YbhB/YbcL family Raf kinase inhibitor-like protein [Patescibacteria group bacterium]|nr:YbhB/YbcL family Raf kinase inhibitor-like protein [Patescibacteria group bacterium]
MELSSPAFGNNQPIPDVHTAKGGGVPPPLAITSVPSGTQSLALIVHDPDAVSGDYAHWVVWNISASTTWIPENHIPAGAMQGINDSNQQGYIPPSPPSGRHRYVFDMYALNNELPIKCSSNAKQLIQAMQGHIIGQAQLIGLVSA